MTVPVIRMRAKRPKTRTGCYTCKARHVKCDEAKPVCGQCTRSRRCCLGYPSPKTNGTIAATREQFLRPKEHLFNTILAPAVVDSYLSPLERRTLDFFHQQTLHELTGGPLSKVSWHRLLSEITMRLCFHEPAVAHISAALGAINQAHRYASQPALVKERECFAEDQSTKAATALRRYINAIPADKSQSTAEVVLLSSLLFFCFELWRGRDHAASVHFQSGLRILYQQHSGNSPAAEDGGKRLVTLETNPRSMMSLLLQIFVRLDWDVVISRGDPFLTPAIDEPLPASFRSIDEATVHLDVLAASVASVSGDLVNVFKMKRIHNDEICDLESSTSTCMAEALSRTISLDSIPEMAERMDEIRQRLHRWLSASASIPIVPELEHTHMLTRIHFFTIRYETLAWREPDEMFNDELEEQFIYILGQCERFIDVYMEKNVPLTTESAVSTCGESNIFCSLGTSLIGCLCTVAFKCRNSLVRRRCIQVLSSLNLQGVFDQAYITSVVQAVVDIEEARARDMMGLTDMEPLKSCQVPAEARLLGLDIDRQLATFRPDFYKASFGQFVYAVHGSSGNVEVHTQAFDISRPDTLNEVELGRQAIQAQLADVLT